MPALMFLRTSNLKALATAASMNALTFEETEDRHILQQKMRQLQLAT